MPDKETYASSALSWSMRVTSLEMLNIYVFDIYKQAAYNQPASPIDNQMSRESHWLNFFQPYTSFLELKEITRATTAILYKYHLCLFSFSNFH